MLVHGIEGQPVASTYVLEKGVSLFTVIVRHPVELLSNQRLQRFTLQVSKHCASNDPSSHVF